MKHELQMKIASMEPKMMKSVIHMREIHACLMELDRNKMNDLQKKAVLLNYLSGDGRKLDSVPHSYAVPDGRGGYYTKETYFVHKN